MRDGKKNTEDRTPKYAAEDEIDMGEVINASGHKQELDRNFGLPSICAVGIYRRHVGCSRWEYCKSNRISQED